MAQIKFDAAKVKPSTGEVLEGDYVEDRVVDDNGDSLHEFGLDANKDLADKINNNNPGEDTPRRKRGRPPIQKDELEIEIEETYRTEYAKYVAECQTRNEQIDAAKAQLVTATKQKRDLVDQWDAYIAEIRANVLRLKASPKPVPPVKGE